MLIIAAGLLQLMKDKCRIKQIINEINWKEISRDDWIRGHTWNLEKKWFRKTAVRKYYLVSQCLFQQISLIGLLISTEWPKRSVRLEINPFCISFANIYFGKGQEIHPQSRRKTKRDETLSGRKYLWPKRASNVRLSLFFSCAIIEKNTPTRGRKVDWTMGNKMRRRKTTAHSTFSTDIGWP